MEKKGDVEIGKRIRETRKGARLTRNQAAENCGITNAFYGNIEWGDKKMSVETLKKVSLGLSVSADYLLFGKSVARDEVVAEVLAIIEHAKDDEQVRQYMDVIRAVLRGDETGVRSWCHICSWN